jgi:hypothetical protein
MKKLILPILILFIIIYFVIIQLYPNTKIKNNTLKFIKLLNTKYNNNLPKLLFIPHVELGDSIALNGIVRYYCTIYNTVFMPCKNSYYNQIKFMYSDLSNLVLINIPDHIIYINIKSYIPYDDNIIELYNNYNIKILTLGCYNILYNQLALTHKAILSTFPTWIYETLNLNNTIAYDYFKINRDYIKENDLYNKLINIIGKKYIVVIDDEKRNFTINPKYLSHIKYPIFKMSHNSKNFIQELNLIKDPIIFNNIKILENATEIISIDTSIPWIIDFLNINVKTSVHTYMRDGDIKYKNKNIKIINGNYIERLSAYTNLSTYNSKMCNIFK